MLVAVLAAIGCVAAVALDTSRAFGVPCTSGTGYSNIQKLGTVTTFSINASGDARVTGTVHWGDGADTAVTGVGQELEHEWKAPGTYHITFDGSGVLGEEPCSSSAQSLGDVTVLAPLKAKIDYHAGKTSATVDASGSTPASQITVYRWTFDDGKTDQGQQVTHAFTKGRHYVSLRILDGNGQQASATRTIFVGVAPKADQKKASSGSSSRSDSSGSSRSGSKSDASASKDGSSGNRSSKNTDTDTDTDSSGNTANETEHTQPEHAPGVSRKRRFCLAANDFAEISTPLLERGVPVAQLETTFVTRYENDRKQMQIYAPPNLKATVAEAFVATDLLLGGTTPTRAQFLTTADADTRLADYCS